MTDGARESDDEDDGLEDDRCVLSVAVHITHLKPKSFGQVLWIEVVVTDLFVTANLSLSRYGCESWLVACCVLPAELLVLLPCLRLHSFARRSEWEPEELDEFEKEVRAALSSTDNARYTLLFSRALVCPVAVIRSLSLSLSKCVARPSTDPL